MTAAQLVPRGAPPAAAADGAAGGARADERLRVLLVEDNPSDARIIRALLTGGDRAGAVTVAEAIWLREALDRLARSHYDIVLLDVFLPDARNLEALEQVRRQAPGVPVVVLTARDDEHVAVQAVRAGAQDYLCKGRIDADVLMRSIRHAIERHRLTAQLEVALSRRAEAERTLHRREEYFRALIENASDLTAVVEADGITRYVSPSVEALLGYRPEELVGTSVLELVHPDDRAVAIRAFARAVRRPALNAQAEYRVRHRDGSWRTLHSVGSNQLANPAVQGLVVNSRDTSGRRQAELERERVLSLVRATLEATADGILVVDAAGRVAGYNQQLARMWRLAEPLLQRRADEELLGSALQQLRDPEGFRARVTELNAQPEAEAFDVVEFTDGRVFERFTKPQQIGGETVGRVWSFRDVTERRRLESRMQHAQKMEAVGQLAGGIAHDFNNILMAIKGATSLLLAEVGGQSPLRRELVEIEHAADHAATLTRQLLAFSRRQALQPEVITLNQVVAGMEQMLRRVLGDPVAIECRLDPALAHVRVDPGQMKQVVLNLAVNARDSMPQGGVLRIRTANLPPGEPRLAECAQFAGGAVALEVSDTGTGMDEATRARIFEPFYTTKEPGKGTGLGLSTVDGIVRQSGGDLLVESAVGAGSTFTVLLPAVAESGVRPRENGAASAERAAPGAQPAPRERPFETVLLVEDADAVRRIARRILERGGYHVLEACGAAEALRAAEEHPGEIHLLLTDVMMPGLSGPALAERFLRLRPGTPVVYMSGYAENAMDMDGTLAPGTRMLNKPFEPAAMLQSIRHWLDGG